MYVHLAKHPSEPGYLLLISDSDEVRFMEPVNVHVDTYYFHAGKEEAERICREVRDQASRKQPEDRVAFIQRLLTECSNPPQNPLP